MVNSLTRKKLRENAHKEPEQMIMVRNLTELTQIHGIYKIPSGGEWVSIPSDLAKRLAGDINYEVAGIGYKPSIPPRRAPNVLRHPAALSRGYGNYDNPALGRLFKDCVEKKELSEYPRVSIVIPVFNYPELLENCVKSLKLTNYDNKRLNIIFVDNASCDEKSINILNKMDHVIRLNTPEGFSSAVNKGIAYMESDYYVLFNQDCEVIDPEWLINMIRWMELRPQCGVSGAKLLYPDGTIQHAGLDLPAKSCGMHRYLRGDPNNVNVNYYERVMACTGAVICVRDSVYKALRGLDEEYKFGCEDTDLCLRNQVILGMETWYNPDCVVRHIDNGIRNKLEASDKKRITDWCHLSDTKFRKDWGKYIDKCDTGSVSFVLPTNDGTSGGCRVVWALANAFVNAGIETTVYTIDGKRPDDNDFPVLFQSASLGELFSADILIATRFDTVKLTEHIPANKKYYFVQQIETVMAKYCGATERDVLDSYKYKDYEIITIGEHLAKRLKTMGRDSTVLDVGLYTDLYRKLELIRIKSKPNILFMASGGDYKGSNEMPLVVSEIRKKIPDANIMTFHRNNMKPKWSDEHHQPKTSKEVAYLYNKADVYVCCPLSEGFAMTPIESMSCGTPVIMSDFPGKDQYAVNGVNCLIAKYRDAKDIANKTKEILSDNALRNKCIENGRRISERYDWNIIRKQYLSHIFGI